MTEEHDLLNPVHEHRWEQITLQVNASQDRLGKGIDQGIKDTVIALQAHEINTLQSCEGHLHWGTGAPWVEIGAKVAEKGEQQITSLLQALDGVEHQHASPLELEKLEEQLGKLQAETTRENLTERRKLMFLLQKYYEHRHVPYEQQLVLQSYGLGRTRLESQGAALQAIEVPEFRQQKLQAYQQEMNAFAQFLRESYFMSSTQPTSESALS